MLYSIVGLILFILWIIAVVDILKSSMSMGAKLLWILVVFLFPLVGLIIYMLVGRKT